MAKQQYERDEFDEIAAAGGPVGVHRAPRPWWTVVITPLIVFVVAGLAAFLVAQVLWSSGGSSDTDAAATSSPDATVSADASTDATTEPSESAAPEASESAEPEPSEEPEPVIDLDASISVLNGAGINGLAGRTTDVLTGSGFTAVTPANLTGERPAANQVVYGDDAMADTAQEVADTLGIDLVTQGETQSGDAVEVQLVSDLG
ncbi:LytR C-terminal domain-containing protein [Demequina pelophila]|uniref:LytR C-terminal domain-containing protein n=1 Tax=Demequina pelophila TaxID=1638984 RepID=UPI0007814BA6|nr:LytR C-terminal domain-containing protein [Demequina pelophila]